MTEIAHAERAHALLSASGAHRWLHCTPSARLEATLPDTESEAAKKGTLAHEIAELKLQKVFSGLPTRKFNAELKKFKAHELYEPIMDDHTDAYLDYIQSIVHTFPSPPFVAIERRVDLTDYVPESFGTGDCIIIGGGKLYINDYKNGQGVPVSAEDNPQMKLYALGAYKAFSLLFPIQEIHLAIIQPKVWDQPSEWSLPVADLLAWGESIKPIAQAAYNGEGEYTIGDHCGFCRAKATCRARTGHMLNAGSMAPLKPPLLSWDEVGEVLRKADGIVKWYEALKKATLAEVLKGGQVAGWKAVEGRGSRDYTDMDKAFSHLKEKGIDEAVLYERKPLTPPQLEDALTKKVYKELLEDTGFVVKHPGAPTLAPDGDKRPAITNQVKPEDAFSAPIE
ncbi:PD-(D/E)XK nuclease superfamily protein [compost metagenome]